MFQRKWLPMQSREGGREGEQPEGRKRELRLLLPN